MCLAPSCSEVGGISEETESCDWWSLGAILFELLTGVVSQKKKVHKCLLSLLLRCCGMSVGVWRSLPSHSLWSCQLVCDRARVRLHVFEAAGVFFFASWLRSFTLVLGDCQGCRCDFLPQPELHLPGRGGHPSAEPLCWL